MTEQRTEETRVERWVYLRVYPDNPGPYLVKELAEDWDKRSEQERQEWLYECAVEFGWGGAYSYVETKRANK